jgi:hypothetical protein
MFNTDQWVQGDTKDGVGNKANSILYFSIGDLQLI